jgi:hypothetical protein
MNKCDGILLLIFAFLKARDLYDHIIFKGQWSQCNMEGCKAKLELLARSHVHFAVRYPINDPKNSLSHSTTTLLYFDETISSSAAMADQ